MRKAIVLTAAALALTLSACSKNDSSGAPAGGSVAAVAPPAGKQWIDVVTPTPEGGFVMGNPNAAIKLVEYGSRTCPHCGKFAAEGVPALEKSYVASGKVSYEFRDFLIHAPDLAASLLGRCGGADVYYPMLEQMYADQANALPKLEKVPQEWAQQLQSQPIAAQAAGWASQIGYLDFVKQRGVSEDQAKQCLADGKAISTLEAELKRATQEFNIQGTPSFIINGKLLENVNDWGALEPELKKAGA